MLFFINNATWQIQELESEELQKLYEEERKEKAYFVFGVTKYSQHIIYINKDMCMNQKVSTLKHELTHCYIWSYGLYNVTEITEEILCDIVACSNDFINEIVERYIKEVKKELVND